VIHDINAYFASNDAYDCRELRSFHWTVDVCDFQPLTIIEIEYIYMCMLLIIKLNAAGCDGIPA